MKKINEQNEVEVRSQNENNTSTLNGKEWYKLV